MSSSVFYKWVKKYTAVKVSDTEMMTMKEINEMRKRLAELEEENIFLQLKQRLSLKTVTIFTKE